MNNVQSFFRHLAVSIAAALLCFITLQACGQQTCAFQSHNDDTSFTLCFNHIQETGYFIFNIGTEPVAEFDVTVTFTDEGFYIDGVGPNGRMIQPFKYWQTVNDTSMYVYEYNGETYAAHFKTY